MDTPAHSIVLDDSRCTGCVACCKACPTRAIRVRDGRQSVDAALCIDCGECIRVCPHDAMTARMSSPSDLGRFRHTVAIPSTALYSQFGRGVRPEQVAGALLHIGFTAFDDVSWMCQMVGGAVDTYLSECQGPWPKISATCPAVIRLILQRYPDLIPHVVPIETPRELTAKLARRRAAEMTGLSPGEIGVFYISPCSAIMQSITSPVGLPESYFDGAFSVAGLYASLLKAIRAGCPPASEESFDHSGLRWGLTGGESAGMRNANSLAVSGVSEVVRVFDSIEAGKFQMLDFVEAHICPDGCIGGQLLVEGRHLARHALQEILAHVTEKSARGPVRWVQEEKIRSMFRDRFFDMAEEIKARPLKREASDLQHAILLHKEKTRVLEGLPGRDCAACGAPDCATFASDVVTDRAELSDCVFVRLEQLTKPPKENGT
jgi:iron only hydrogenase large subunit-like protein